MLPNCKCCHDYCYYYLFYFDDAKVHKKIDICKYFLLKFLNADNFVFILEYNT